MNFPIMNEYFEKSKLWVSYLFVFISILSMSSLVYKKSSVISYFQSLWTFDWKCDRDPLYGNLYFIIYHVRIRSIKEII